MDETSKMERDLSSAAAFVEGGIQDACDDACSICLEEFCESDPSTVTDCKHEFHLQCILEWCQRSSQCPMCWQSISLKDSTSQELFQAVERERNIRQNQARTTTIFHHPAFVDFELQHLPISGSDSELEERIMQHLAAAAAMGRVHHISRREGQQGRSGSHRHPQFLVFSPHPNAPYVGYRSASSAQVGENESNPAIFATSSSSIPSASVEEPHITPVPAECNGATVTETSSSQSWFSPSTSSNPGSHLASSIQVSPGPSDLQSFSESLRSRLSAVSMKYKESITKSTRGWRERFFSRNSAVADLGSEVRREPHAGNDTVSHMIDRLQIRENRTGAFPSTDAAHPTIESNNEVVTRSHVNTDPNDSATSAPC